MIRTQISLSNTEYELVKKEAKSTGVSIAEILRRSLRKMFPINSSKPWMRYAGIVASGDSQASQNIDDLIYGIKD